MPVRKSASKSKAAPKKASRPTKSPKRGPVKGKSPRAAKAPGRAKTRPPQANRVALEVVEASAPQLDSAAPVRTGERSSPDATRSFAMEAARLVRDDKCEDVVVLDIRGISSVSDYVIVASGTSERQMRSVLQHVEELGASMGFKPFRASRDDRTAWLLIDFVDVVVHLFEPNTRAHYDLEMLWGDAPRVDWERADQKERDRAGLAAKPRNTRVEENA